MLFCKLGNNVLGCRLDQSTLQLASGRTDLRYIDYCVLLSLREVYSDDLCHEPRLRSYLFLIHPHIE